MAQVHRSNRGEQQTKVDIAGTLDVQMSAKLLIEGTLSQPLKSYSKGKINCLHKHRHMHVPYSRYILREKNFAKGSYP